MSGSANDQASRKIGEYMLKGWILSNESCSVASCPVPMMYSPDRSKSLCVVHGSPVAEPSTPDPSPSRASSSTAPISRTSTPPTPLSNGPASPTFILPEPSAETLARRAQSDLASQRIGQKMLQGYAMLGEECLNPECIGVPLVRPPRQDGTKDPHKECVVCGNVYVQARGGLELVVSGSAPLVIGGSASAAVPVSGGSRTITSRKEVNGRPGMDDGSMGEAPTPTGKGKGKAAPKSSTLPSTGDDEDVLRRVLTSVDRALGVLSDKLDVISRSDNGTEMMLMGEAAKQMTALLETRHAVRREARGEE